jgi:parvulin-like peptidyl-prolyl isomerase
MKKRLPLVLIILIAIGLVLIAGYKSLKDQEKKQKEAGKISLTVFRVEEKTYSLADFEQFVKNLNPGQQELADDTLSQLFDQFIEDKLVLYSARKQGLELTDAERQAFLRRMIKDYPVEEGLSERLAGDESLNESLLIEKYKYEKIKEVVVTEGEIKQYYQENKKDFLVPERVKVSQILVKSSDLAVKLREKLEKATEDEFRQAARNFSEAPDGYKGGLMGIFKPGDLPYDMERVVFSLEEGKLSPVFESPYGFHIFRLNKKYPPALLELAEAAPKIRNLLLEAKVKDIVAKEVEELKATYHWEVYPENLSFKYEGKNND